MHKLRDTWNRQVLRRWEWCRPRNWNGKRGGAAEPVGMRLFQKSCGVKRSKILHSIGGGPKTLFERALDEHADLSDCGVIGEYDGWGGWKSRTDLKT